jgi:hypothetical protein
VLNELKETWQAVAAQVEAGELRWVVESTNSWLSNCGQLRQNTDRRTRHRHAQLCLAAVLLITAKLIDWRDRWSPEPRPIR